MLWFTCQIWRQTSACAIVLCMVYSTNFVSCQNSIKPRKSSSSTGGVQTGGQSFNILIFSLNFQLFYAFSSLVLVFAVTIGVTAFNNTNQAFCLGVYAFLISVLHLSVLAYLWFSGRKDGVLTNLRRIPAHTDHRFIVRSSNSSGWRITDHLPI